MSVRLKMIEADIAELSEDRQAFYHKLVSEGEAPSIAHMLTLMRGPQMSGSDMAFNEGQRRKMENMGAGRRSDIISIANKAGIRTDGKYYMSGLGRYDDPAAWVSTVDDVKDVAKAKNLNVSGIVNHKATPVPPPKDKPLAEDLIQESCQEHLYQSPKLREKMKKQPKKTVAELREKVIATHGAKKA